MTGWQAFDAADQNVDDVAPLYRTNGPKVEPSPVREALQTGLACGPLRGVVLHRKDGHRYVVEESANPITDRHGQLSGAVMVLHDVTETMALAERMAHLAQYDALTDLPNRVLLLDHARHALALARRDGKSLAVMYLDLDGFKQPTTPEPRHGRQLQLRLRRLQAASCRGDEFVVLLPGLDAQPVGGGGWGRCAGSTLLQGLLCAWSERGHSRNTATALRTGPPQNNAVCRRAHAGALLSRARPGAGVAGVAFYAVWSIQPRCLVAGLVASPRDTFGNR
jgi:PAS domain S-box-containing protein